jgi:hypothetical protein
MALVQSSPRQKPASGSVFAFRGRHSDRIKLLLWDGQGFCLYYKVPGEGPLSLAVRDRRHGPADVSTVVVAMGRYRLAASRLDLSADTRCAI